MENNFKYHTEHFWTSAEAANISKALCLFNAANIRIEKNGEAKITETVKRKYVKLDDIMNVVRPELAKVECYVEQHLAGDSVITRVVHISGEFIASKLHYQTWEGTQVNNLQRLGGGLTYLKRYAISAILNIVADEDTDADGNDGVAYKKPDDDNREWLNLRNKNGSPSVKGQAAIQFVKQGGSVDDIKKKYRINKTDLQELLKLQAQAQNAIENQDGNGDDN